jgi:hypothetical protein
MPPEYETGILPSKLQELGTLEEDNRIELSPFHQQRAGFQVQLAPSAPIFQYLVLPARIELATRLYQSRVIPFYYGSVVIGGDSRDRTDTIPAYEAGAQTILCYITLSFYFVFYFACYIVSDRRAA